MKKMTQLEAIYREALENIKNTLDGCGMRQDEEMPLSELLLLRVAREALSAQGGAGMDHPPKNLEEFRVRLFNDPVAYAYYTMGRAVEQDYRTDPYERASREELKGHE